MIIKYLSFPVGNRHYGGGGWSKMARHKPLPIVVTQNINRADIKFKNKSVFIHGLRKLKINIFTNRGKIIRQDYPQINFNTAVV